MDSFEWNKIAGGVLGSLLFVVAVKIAAGFIFEVEPPAKPGYVVQGVETTATAGTTQAVEAEEPLPDWGTVLPKADVAAGKAISARCEQCHDLSKGGPNKIGPNLWGVVGRPRASHPGFDYSAAMKAKGGAWTYDELFKFLKSPGAYIPGTKMSFAGLKSPKDRINLIAYLRTDMDTPAPIPPPHPTQAAPASVPKGGSAPAAAPGAGAGAPATQQGPNGIPAVAPGNQPQPGAQPAGAKPNPAAAAGSTSTPAGQQQGTKPPGGTTPSSSAPNAPAKRANGNAPAGKQPAHPGQAPKP